MFNKKTRIFVALLALLFQTVSGAPKYNPASSTTTNDLTTAGYCTNTPAGYVKSPILIKHSICQPYGEFKLTLPDYTATAALGAADSTYGAPKVDYGNAVLTFNGTTYTSTQILFRTMAEHVLFEDFRHGDGEIQILMRSTDGKLATLAFVIKEIPATTSAAIYTQSANAQVLNNADVSASSWKINFKNLQDLIMIAKQEKEVFLNMLTYNGTRTFGACELNTWFVYGSELYMTKANLDKIRTLTAAYTNAENPAALSLTHNARPYAVGTGGGGGEMEAARLCYTGYFKNHMGDNYGLWFGVGSILLFFIFTLTVGEKPIRDYDYQENVWTIHPLYSMVKVNNEIHTLKTRASLFLAMITIHGLFSSVFYRDASDPKKSSNTIVFAVYSMLINWAITLFVGNILRSYYIAKYQFYKTKEESWDQKAQNRLFGFYFSVFVIVVVGWAFTVWNMGELHAELDPEPSDLWVASFFIGIGLEMIIVYPIVCILSKGSRFIRRFAKSVGFMYDNLCHETYSDFLKHD